MCRCAKESCTSFVGKGKVESCMALPNVCAEPLPASDSLVSSSSQPCNSRQHGQIGSYFQVGGMQVRQNFALVPRLYITVVSMGVRKQPFASLESTVLFSCVEYQINALLLPAMQLFRSSRSITDMRAVSCVCSGFLHMDSKHSLQRSMSQSIIFSAHSCSHRHTRHPES